MGERHPDECYYGIKLCVKENSLQGITAQNYGCAALGRWASFMCKANLVNVCNSG